MEHYSEAARSLETVNPDAPMTAAALAMALSQQLGRPVTRQELTEAPAIAEGATRAEYAAVLRQRWAGTHRRALTLSEYNAAWHAVEGAAGQNGADPTTVLHAVLDALGILRPGERPAAVAVSTGIRAAIEGTGVAVLPEGDQCCTGVRVFEIPGMSQIGVIPQVRGLEYTDQSPAERDRAAEMAAAIKEALPAAGWRVARCFSDSFLVEPAS